MSNINNKIITRYVLYAAAAIAASAVCGSLYWFFTDTAGEWFTGLLKPGFMLPETVSTACWALLFVLMAVSIYLVLNKGGFHGRALHIALLALALVPLWAFVLFAGQNVVSSFVLGIIAFVVWAYAGFCAYRRNKPAGYLLILPTLWIGFCAAINYMLFMMN